MSAITAPESLDHGSHEFLSSFPFLSCNDIIIFFFMSIRTIFHKAKKWDLANFQERRKTLWDKLNENFGFNKKSHLYFGVF